MNASTNARSSYNSAGGIPPGPGAHPFLKRLIAAYTSSTDGSSIETEVSTGVDAASLSSSFDGTPGWWFNADMKCSCQRSSVSSSERHGDPSDLWMVVPVTFLFPDSSRIALMSVSSSSQRLFKKTSRSCLALALNTPCNRLRSTILF